MLLPPPGSASPTISGGEAADHEPLDRIALDVASELRYEAARHDGEPSAVWIGQPLRFPDE